MIEGPCEHLGDPGGQGESQDGIEVVPEVVIEVAMIDEGVETLLVDLPASVFRFPDCPARMQVGGER